jgi:hypothetical protein
MNFELAKQRKYMWSGFGSCNSSESFKQEEMNQLHQEINIFNPNVHCNKAG